MVTPAKSAEGLNLTECPLAYTLDDLRQVNDLYRDIRRKPHLERYVRNLTDHCVQHAGDEKSWTRSCLHRCLAEIYAAHFVPGSAAPDIEFDPFIVEIQRQLEDAWFHYEDARVDLSGVPSEASEFVEWFRSLVIEEHPASRHPLFGFLGETANRYEMAYFIQNETTLDARFDDLIALAQIGLPDKPKLELARNYWDEMGEGKLDMMHTRLLGSLLDTLGLHLIPDNFTANWTALACGNLLCYLTLHHSHGFEAIGALGAVEMLAPNRFRKLLQGFDRIGLPPSAQVYHRIHIEVDAGHADDWLEHVVRPIVAEDPEAGLKIATGAYYRLNTSLDYCDSILAHLTNQGYCGSTEDGSQASERYWDLVCTG